MTHAIPLSELFRVRARFCRSVNLAADYREPGALSDYIVTPLARDVLRRIVEGLQPDARTRAWSITGPYGAGKSACALFAAKVLGYPVNSDARALLRAADPDLHARVFHQLPTLADGGFFLVLSVGSRQPISLAILEGLADGLSSWPVQDATIADLQDHLRALIAMSTHGGSPSVDDVMDAVKRTACAVRSSNSHALGLLMIMDELGKLLEYAALNPGHGDIFILQSLAELASRSGDSPIALIAILHLAFERYADRLSPAQKQEWRKVQGRFEDIAFLEPQGELLKLIGTAIEPTGQFDGLADVLSSEASKASRLDIAPRELGLKEIQGALTQCAPLHPTVALILGRLFRNRLAQNERSLFAFLTSGEPHALQDYLKRESWAGNGARPFYRLDLLYDYMVSALGSALYAQAQGKKWAEIENALERLPADSPPIDSRLVKAIGLLGLMGDQRYLKASAPVLAYALADGHTSEGDVHDSLSRLFDLKIAVYRRHRDAYGLWEGSDVDLDERFQKGLDRIDRSASLASLLRDYGRLRPYVAKRHLHQTGTLRYFAPVVADIEELREVLKQPIGGADGYIVFVLANHGSQPSETLEAVSHVVSDLPWPHKELLFIAIPKDLSGIREALEEVLAWQWVSDNTPELAGDGIARKELAGRQLDAASRLDHLVNQCFDKASSYSACIWLWQDHTQPFATARDLASALSDACDLAYRQAPRVHNELVNRRSLSSSAAAARRTLIERMLENPTQPRFGIDSGFPPELSMYLSVLRHTGLHHPEASAWILCPCRDDEPHRMKPMWRAIDGFLGTTEAGKQPVSELFALLREPPFGIRDGLLPIFLAAALVHWEQEVALFENGTFIPKVDIAAFERLIKAPDQFALQRYRLEGARLYTLERYAALLDGNSVSAAPPTLLSAVRPILTLMKRLPTYARSTRSVSPAAVAVRDFVFAAREPHKLLFKDLPQALGLSPAAVASNLESAQAFFSSLRAALLEIQDAYTSLLSQLLQLLTDALQLPPDIAQARLTLQQQAIFLQPYVTDLKLKAFLHLSAQTGTTEQAWLESLAANLASKPPAQWTDIDLTRFKTSLLEVVGQLRRVQELALEAGVESGDAETGRLLRLSVMETSRSEQKDVLRVLPEEEARVRAAADHIETQLRDEQFPARLRLAVLAELATRLLSHQAVMGAPNE